MSKVKLENIQPISRGFLKHGTFIVLLHTDKIPPHLALICNGRYYSLTSDENQVGISLNGIWRAAVSKAIQTLFIEVDSECSETLLDELFSKYDHAIPGKLTCLQPLKEYFNEHHLLPIHDVDFVFHLINRLEEYNMLGRTFQLNMEEALSNDSFTLLEYTLDDIYSRIASLQKEPANA